MSAAPPRSPRCADRLPETEQRVAAGHPGAIPLSLHLAMLGQYAVGGAFLPFVSLHFLDLGVRYSELGWIFLSSSAVAATVPFLGGVVADRWVSAEKLYACLHLAGAAFLGLLALQESFPGVLAGFVLVCAAYHPTSSILSAISYHNLHAPEAQFAKLRLWGSIGWVLPSIPIYVWLLGGGPSSLRFTLWIAAALEVLVAVLALGLPRTPPGSRHLDPAGGVLPYGAALRTILRRPEFLGLLAVTFLMQSAFTLLFYYSPPHLETAGIPRSWVGPIQCLGVVAEVPLFFLLPRIIARLGYRRTIGIGCIALFARHCIYAVTLEPWLLVSSWILAGVCVVFYLTGISLSVNSMAERSIRATAQTMIVIAGPGLGQMFGHRVAGWLASTSGGDLRPVFVFAAACAGLAFAIILAAGFRRRFYPSSDLPVPAPPPVP